MINVLFVILFFTFPIFYLVILKINNINLFKIDIISFLILSLFVFSYIGIFPLFFYLDEYRFNLGLTNKNILLEMLILSSWTILGITFGSNLVRDKKVRLDFFSKQTIRPLNKSEIIYIIIFFFLCLLFLGSYISKVPKIALFVALLESVSEAKIARSMMTNDFGGGFHWYRLFINEISNILTFILFSNWLVKKNRKTLILFITTFLFSVLTSIISTQKAPLIWLLISLFFVHFLVKFKGEIPIRKFFTIFLFLLGILLLMYVYFMGSKDFGSALTSVLSRAFTGQISASYYYLEFIPHHQDYLLGKSFPNPGGIMPYTPYRLQVEIMDWRFPDLAEMGIVGSAPTVFWAESYANFGYLGVFLIPIMTGVFLGILDNKLKLIENTPIKTGVYIWFVFHYGSLSTSSFSNFFIDIYFWGVLIFLFLMYSFCHNFKIKIFSKINGS